MEYRELSSGEMSKDLFESFIRHQKVTHCWHKLDKEPCDCQLEGAL